MSKIKIVDLPVLEDLDAKQAKGIFGGALMEPTISRKTFSFDSFTNYSTATFTDSTLTKNTDYFIKIDG